LVFLLLIAVAAGCVLAATPAQAKLTGAVWTTLPDGTAVDHNVYAAKEDVYLNAGPTTQSSGAWVPDGDYYFMVTDPPGKKLLSQDAVGLRMVKIRNGMVVQPGIPGDTPIPPYTNHKWANDAARPGNITIQLMPYADSKNGEYKMWVTRVEDYQPGNPASKFGFLPSDSKTDNFRVRRARLLIFGYKFADLDGDGTWDQGEPPLPNWEIQLYMKVKNAWVYQDSSFTAGDGSYGFQITQAGQYRIIEVLQATWTQTKPLNPNIYELTITKAMLTAGTPLGPYNFGNTQGPRPPGAVLSGLKYADLDRDGFPDLNEPGIADWAITIVAGQFDGNGDFVCDLTVKDLSPQQLPDPWTVYTDATGAWEKDDLPQGYVYKVCEEQKAGWTQTGPADQTLDLLPVFAKDLCWYATVPVGVNDDPNWHKLDFGNYGCGRIIVYKFEDHNGDGIENGLDGPYSGWTMFLYDANPPNSLQFPKLLAWGPTMKDDPLTPEDETGYIEFPIDPEACLPYGTYIVSEMSDVNWTCTTCTHGPWAIDVTITPQDPVAFVEFGNYYFPCH
jgi:hypothetical protein